MENNGAEKVKKNKILAALPYIAPLIIIAAAAAVIFSGVFSAPAFYHSGHSAAVIKSGGGYYVVFDSEKPFYIENAEAYYVNRGEPSVIYLDGEKALYYLKSGSVSPVKLADNVLSCGFSDSRNRLVWYIDGDHKLFVIKKIGENGVLIDELDENDTVAASLYPISSQNGEYFYYRRSGGWYVNGEKLPYMAATDHLFAVDKNRTLYYINSENEITAMKKDGEPYFLGELEIYSQNGGYSAMLEYNYDQSEIMYQRGGKIYVSDYGSAGKEIFDGTELEIIYPGSAVRCMDFKNIYASSDGKIYKLKKAGEAAVFIADGEGFCDNSGENLLISSEEGYKKLLFRWDGIKKTELIGAGYNLDKTVFSGDFKNIFFTDRDGNLFYIKNFSKPVRLGANAADIIMSNDGKTCFITKTDGIYYSESGGSEEKVRGIEGELIKFDISEAFSLIYTDTAVFRYSGGGAFEKLFDLE